jgi:hypothetical protein
MGKGKRGMAGCRIERTVLVYVLAPTLLAIVLPWALGQDTPPPSAAQTQQQNGGGAQQPPATPTQQPDTQSTNPASEQKAPAQAQPNPSDKKEESGNAAQVVGDMTKQVAAAGFRKVRDWEVGLITGAYVSKNRRLVPLTKQQREYIYLQQTLASPSAYWKRMFQAGIDQARDAPPQWGGGWGGYGKRWASREGQFITANSLAAWGNARLGYEPRYEQCRCGGFWARTEHAFGRNFYTYDRTEKNKHPQWALYGGALMAGMLSAAWKPGHDPLKDGLYGVVGQAGWGTLLNFFIEFSTDINRKLGARR